VYDDDICGELEDEDLVDVHEEDFLNTTPTKLIEVADFAAGDLLPSKSRQCYERTYREFQKWQAAEKTKSISERTLLAYFSTLSTEKKNKPTTLWAYYSMLKSMIHLNEGVDISTYGKIIGFLKRKADGYQLVKAKTFTEEEMRKFVFKAPDKGGWS